MSWTHGMGKRAMSRSRCGGVPACGVSGPRSEAGPASHARGARDRGGEPGAGEGQCIMTDNQAPPMFEPDAESMPLELLAGLQQERLRGLIDRLLAAGGVPNAPPRDAGVTHGAHGAF